MRSARGLLLVGLALLLAAAPEGIAHADGTESPPSDPGLAADRRPDADTGGAAPKRLENVTHNEAYALFHSLENVNKTVRYRRGFMGRTLSTDVHYQAGETQQTERGWFLPVRVNTTFRLLGNQFETSKVFLFEWDAQSGVLRAEIDQPAVTRGRFNMRVSNTNGGLLARVRTLDALRSGGAPSGNAALNASTRTVFLQNLPMAISPHLFLNREGAEGFIKVWAGMRFNSEVEATGVVVPGVQRGVSLDLDAQAQGGAVGATRSQEGFQDQADVQVEGVIWASFTYEQKFVRREVRRSERALSFFRQTPSALNVDVRPRFRYQIRSGATVLQGGSHGYQQRYARPRPAPQYAPHARASDWRAPARRAGTRAPSPARLRSAAPR